MGFRGARARRARRGKAGGRVPLPEAEARGEPGGAPPAALPAEVADESLPCLGDADAPLVPAPDPPDPPAAAEPVAVYLVWAALGAGALSLALQWPLAGLVDALSAQLPRWSHVFAAAALLCLGLAALESTRRDRTACTLALGLGAAVFTALSAFGEGLGPLPVRSGWAATTIAGVLGLLHWLVFDDWIAGRRGPRLTQLALGLRDLATWRAWVWTSRRALAMRARRLEWDRRVREQRDRDRLARQAAQDRAAQREAELCEERERLRVAEASEAAARAERRAADAQSEQDEARVRAARAEAERVESESRLAEKRAAIEERNREAAAAALERSRLHQEQLEANRRLLEAAAAARAAAETELASGSDAERARALLRSAEEALASVERTATTRRAG